MPDIVNRLPGRTLLIWVAKPLETTSWCSDCREEIAIAHWVQLLPPGVPANLNIDDAADAMYERWLDEQRQCIARLSPFEVVGVRCIARRCAQYMMRSDIVKEFQAFFANTPFPDHVLGAMAVEAGLGGKAYPMALGVVGSRSLRELMQFLNVPLGTIDATDDVIPLDE